MPDGRISDGQILVCGTINWDTLLFVKKLPSPGEEVKVKRALSVPGGKGANTAVSAARITGPRKVALLATLGNDAIAKAQLSALRKEGVLTDAVLLSDKNGTGSGRAFVAIDRDGQDIILTNMAANSLMNASTLAKNYRVRKVINTARLVVITDPPLNVALWVARQVKKHGAFLIISPALLSLYGLKRLRKYMMLGNCIIVNEQEAEALVGSDNVSGVHLAATLSHHLGGLAVIVTLGKHGCAVSSEGRSAVIPAADLSLLGLKVVSTAGAGDAFVGAFSAFRAKGLDDINSIFRANIAAALKTTKSEIRGGPRLQDVERILENKKVRSTLQRIKFARGHEVDG